MAMLSKETVAKLATAPHLRRAAPEAFSSSSIGKQRLTRQKPRPDARSTLRGASDGSFATISKINVFGIRKALLASAFLILCGLSLEAAPYNNQYNVQPLRTRDEDNAAALREMRDSVENMRHQMNNQESEIRTFDEKLTNLDSIIESVRDQLSDANKSQKELLKGSSTNLETKITALESIVKGLVNDVRQFKTYANETTTALAQYKLTLVEINKAVEQQNQNIDHLQAAMRSLVDVMQVKDGSSAKASSDTALADSLSGNTYTIKPGDSLDKIARANQTSVQAIKDLNGMTNDRIVVGKVLKIPGK